MAASTRIWAVTEKELQEEMAYLKQLPAYRQPLQMPSDTYTQLLRKIAYWRISRMNIIALGIICLLLIGGTVIVYNAQHQLAWVNHTLLKILLINVGIYGGIYVLAGIPLTKYKTKLFVK